MVSPVHRFSSCRLPPDPVRDDGPVTASLIADADLDPLRAALAPFTADAVDDVLGIAGRAALARADLAGARRAVRGSDSPVAALLRLFTLGDELDPAEATRAFGPAVEAAVRSGLVEASAGSMRALLDVRPYAEADGPDWWVVSDLGSDVRRERALPRDHVLGVGSASTALARCTPRDRVGPALDVGTGSGVQALHLSRHACAVTATDISHRALRMAATTAALSGVTWDLRQGSLLEPVAGARYDLVVANPPFVVSPGDGGYDYRDSGMAGDTVCRALVRGLPAVLGDGGCAQLLANWVIPVAGSWRERVGAWLQGSGCDAWVWQREIADPGEYVALWLRDAGADPRDDDYAPRYDAWLDWFGQAGVAAVGMGLITLWRTGTADPVVVLEDVPQAVEQPAGATVADWIRRQRALAALDDATLLALPLQRADAVVLERADVAGSGGGWEPASAALRQSHGMRWTLDTDDAIAALVAACDGTTPVSSAIALLAAGLGVPTGEIATAAAPVLRDLVARGFLDLPAGAT